MATVANLKVPGSRKSSLEIKLAKHVRISVDICGLYGHAWNWQDKVPQDFDGRWQRYFDGPIKGNFEFAEPFRHGYAWACEREGCGVWLSVYQIDSERYVPVARQQVELYGHYGEYRFDPDSPFCGVNQRKTAELAEARG